MKQKSVFELALHGTEDEWFEMIRAVKIVRAKLPEARGNVVQRVGKVTYAFNFSREIISVWISR